MIKFVKQLPQVKTKIYCPKDPNMEYIKEPITYRSLEKIIPDYKYFNNLTWESLKDTDFRNILIGNPKEPTFRKNNMLNGEISNQQFRLYLLKFCSHIFWNQREFRSSILKEPTTENFKKWNPLYHPEIVNFDDWKEVECPKIVVSRYSPEFKQLKMTNKAFEKTIKKFKNANILIEDENNKNWIYSAEGKHHIAKLYHLNILALFQSLILRDNITDHKTNLPILLDEITYKGNKDKSIDDIIPFTELTNEKYCTNAIVFRNFRFMPILSINPEADEVRIKEILNNNTNNLLLNNRESAIDCNKLREHLWNVQKWTNLHSVLYKTENYCNIKWKTCQKNLLNGVYKKITNIVGKDIKDIPVYQLKSISHRYSSLLHGKPKDEYDAYLRKRFVYPHEFDVHSSTMTINHYIKQYKETGKVDFDVNYSAYDIIMNKIKDNKLAKDDYENKYDELRDETKHLCVWYAYRSNPNDFELDNIQNLTTKKLLSAYKNYRNVEIREMNEEEITKSQINPNYKPTKYDYFEPTEEELPYWLDFFRDFHNFYVTNVGKRYGIFNFAIEDYIYFNIEKSFLENGIAVLRKYDGFYYDLYQISEDEFEKNFKEYFEEAIKNLCKYYPNIFDFFPDFVEI